MRLEGIVRGRSGVLLGALVALVVTTPLVEDVTGVQWIVLDVLFTALILALLYTMSRGPHFLVLAGALALPAVALRWALQASESEALVVASFVIQIAFLAVSTWVVFVEILRSERVTTDTMLGGVSIYLLLGIIWALAYGLIDFLQPGALAFQTATESAGIRLPGQAGFAELLYFSFNTLTTLGYGDVVPIAKEARSLVVLEVVAGQIYLMVFVARLVGLHMAHNQPGRFDV